MTFQRGRNNREGCWMPCRCRYFRGIFCYSSFEGNETWWAYK